jgi:hypothetical protein
MPNIMQRALKKAALMSFSYAEPMSWRAILLAINGITTGLCTSARLKGAIGLRQERHIRVDCISLHRGR